MFTFLEFDSPNQRKPIIPPKWTPLSKVNGFAVSFNLCEGNQFILLALNLSNSTSPPVRLLVSPLSSKDTLTVSHSLSSLIGWVYFSKEER